MADLATITIPVDSSAMVRAVKDAKNLERGIKMLVDAFDSGTIGSQQLSKGLLQLKRQYEGLFGTSQKATASVRGHAKSLQESRAAAFAATAAEERLTLAKKKAETAYALGLQRAREEERQLVQTQAEILRLESMYNKVSVAARVYEQAQESLNKAVALGVISADQQEAKLAELSVAYQKVGADANKAQAFINRFGENAQVSGRGLNQFGVYAQQVGYQVGDFLVQVQSGTNFMVAFGQQATQLAGLIPGVLGAALGIGISLFTAIGAAIMRTSESSKTLQDSLTSLEGNVSSLNELVGSITVENYSNMIAKYGELNQAVYDNIGVITQLNAQLISLSQINLGSLFSESFGGILTNRIDEMRIAFETTNDQARVLLMMMDAVGEARGPDQLVQAMTDLRDELIATVGGVDNLTTRQAQFVLEISNAIDKATIAKGKLEQMGGAAPDGTWMNPAIGGVDALIARIEAALGRVNALKTNLKVTAAAAANGGVPELPGVKPLTGGEATVNIENFTKALGGATGGSKALTKELTAAEKAAKEFSDTMDGYVVSAVGGVADAFGDFVMRGFKDFKGFVKNIIGSFKNMLAQMIALAARNQILIGLGFAAPVAGAVGGAAMGAGFGAGVAGAGAATGIGAAFGSAASGLSSGFMTSVYGGLGGTVGAVSGGLSVGGISGISTAIGAIAAPLLAVAAVFSFFKKKTKELDSGLRITVSNMDALVETFKTVQTTRFWGLSKKVKTTVEEASAEVSDPVIKAIQDIQTQVIKAAEMFGIAESEFEDFVYKFDVSLKGLTDEQKIQKINEELLKMGDAFASLTGHFTSMNELLAAAQQRYDLQTRLLELQGDTEALLARQRELELAAVHDLNRSLLLQVHALEDAQRALDNYNRAVANTASAAANLRAAMDRELSTAQAALDSAKAVFDRALSNQYNSLQDNLSKTEQALADAQQALAEAQRRAFEEGIQNRIAAVNASFNDLIAGLEARLDVAQRKAAASREIFEALDSALRDRRLASDAATFASRRSALSYVSSGGTDIDKLTSALSILNEPSEQFFGTFQDYARDFALTTNAIKDSAAVAEATMTADEKTVLLLEQQIEQSRASQEAQVQALEKMLVVQENFLTVSQAMEQLLTAQENYDQAKQAHDELLLQYPQLQETFISVGDALADYLAAQATYEQVQAQHTELIAQFPMLKETFLSVADAVAGLKAAIAEQTAAELALAAAQEAVKKSQEPSVDNSKADAILKELATLVIPEAVSVVASKYVSGILGIDKASWAELSTGERFSTKSGSGDQERLNAVALAQARADELNKEREAALARQATLNAQLDKLREEVIAAGGVPTFATGGMHIGGPRIVGENGPELEVTGPSRIYSNRDTAAMFRDPNLASAVDGLRKEVSGMRSEQLQIQVEVSKNVKRIYDIERKWDTDGLPPERV